MTTKVTMKTWQAPTIPTTDPRDPLPDVYVPSDDPEHVRMRNETKTRMMLLDAITIPSLKAYRVQGGFELYDEVTGVELSQDEYNQRVHAHREETNAKRAAEGLPPLKENNSD